MNKAKEISVLWSQIKPQIGELVRLCHEVEGHYEVTADAYQRGYEAGLNDAWEAARKIVLSREDGGLFEYEARKSAFGCGNYMALKNYSASEAVEKIRQYEQEKKEQIQVLDEVNGKGGKGVITRISDDGNHFNVMWENGSTGYYMIEDFKKTGRNFPEIAEVLKKMQEG